MKLRLGVACALGVLVLGPIFVVVLTRQRLESRKRHCVENLREISTWFSSYQARYHAYPRFGEQTWFGQLWDSGIAMEGDRFRCPVRGVQGPGTHYLGCVQSTITYPGFGPTVYPSNGTITDGAPPDWPMACDGDAEDGPNHPDRTTHVLFFQGRVDSFAVDSPTDLAIRSMLGPVKWAAPAGNK
jgi:hypothetical protein